MRDARSMKCRYCAPRQADYCIRDPVSGNQRGSAPDADVSQRFMEKSRGTRH